MSTRNLRLNLLKKLQNQYIKLFKVFKPVKPTFFMLYIPNSAAFKTIHPVFYICLLRDFVNNGLR